MLICQPRIPFVYSALLSTLSAALETALNTLPSSPNSPQLWRRVFSDLSLFMASVSQVRMAAWVCAFDMTNLST